MDPVDSVPGFHSCHRLATTLQNKFGSEIVVEQFGSDCDAFGWTLPSRPRFSFSASTHAGGLSDGMFDLEVVIVDLTIENGEIVLGPEAPYVSIDDACRIVADMLLGHDA